MSMIEQNLSLYEDKLQFYLVSTTENSQLSSHMQFAREKLEENVNATNIKGVTEAECIDLAGNFTRKHIVIFDKFEGKCFEAIKNTHALILGPRCVISCLMDNVTLPDIDSPMFNLAMRDLIICLSSFTPDEKAKLSKLIGYMGGRCIHQFAESVTHLVTGSIKPKKHEVAVIRDKIIMKDSWVYSVWEKNLIDNILATSSKFDTYKLPIFYKLRVTSTGLSRGERKDVEEIVNKEGGSYFGEFSSGNIDVVIAKRNASETPKIKAALNQGKECLCVEWIHESVTRGAALPVENYLIDLQAKKTTSTPEKRLNDTSIEFTQESCINISNIPFAGTVNDTAMSNLSITSEISINRKRKSNDAANENKDLSYKVAYEKLNFQEAKRAGVFLDGCSIFIIGFTNEEKEKVNKILNAGGATRYDTINSNLSHIVVGSPSTKDVKMLQAIQTDAILVKLDWLVDSIAKKTAVDADKYVYHLNNGKSKAIADEQATAPSPASKRNILLMSQSSKQGTPKRLNFDANSSKDQTLEGNNNTTLVSQTANKPPHGEDEIIGQYLIAPAPPPTPKEPAKIVSEPVAGPSKPNELFKVPAQPAPTNESEFETDSEFGSTMNDHVMFLAKQKVFIRGFDTESHESLVEDCKIAGAEVIEDDEYKGMVDFLILPVDAITMEGVKVKAKTIVNHNWLINAKRLYQVAESVIADPLSDIPYFYRPIIFPEDLMPLANMVIVISLYSSDERTFLFQMGQILGADVQETYTRQNKPLLICPEARSAKYDAAIRWRLPVVNKNWLLECYKLQKRIPMRNYLVGDAIAPVDDVDDDDEVLCSQSVVLNPDSMSSNKDTPVIQNKRVEQLRLPSNKSNPNSNKSSPASNNSGPSSPLIPTFNQDVLKELDTPTRESILQRWKELDEQTPETKRRRYEKDGIKTPEIATTPYWMEYKRQQCEERRTRHAPTQEQIDKIRNRTPWSEVKRNFWKQALGDEYESPSQCYSVNMRQDVSVSHVNESIIARPAGRMLSYDPQGETEADQNIKALADLINKNKEGNNEPLNYVDLPNTAPPDSEMTSTEQHEVIGWRDPSEAVEDTPKRNAKFKKQHCFSISCTSDDVKNKLIKQINTLNGKVCEDLIKYDSACSHFVCEKPSRSEKMLSCVASGKWVLGLNYIQKSFEANRFLDEEEFEWGNPKATELPRIDGNDVGIANAAFRWRKKLHSIMVPSQKGIFKDLRVILKTGKDESLRRLIEAGLGHIIEVNPNSPLDKQITLLTDATHVICQSSYANFTAEEIKALDQMNVHRVTVNYLQSCITSETTPDVKAFLFKTGKA